MVLESAMESKIRQSEPGGASASAYRPSHTLATSTQVIPSSTPSTRFKGAPRQSSDIRTRRQANPAAAEIQGQDDSNWLRTMQLDSSSDRNLVSYPQAYAHPQVDSSTPYKRIQIPPARTSCHSQHRTSLPTFIPSTNGPYDSNFSLPYTATSNVNGTSSSERSPTSNFLLPIALQRLKEADLETFKLARACGMTPDPVRISRPPKSFLGNERDARQGDGDIDDFGQSAITEHPGAQSRAQEKSKDLDSFSSRAYAPVSTSSMSCSQSTPILSMPRAKESLPKHLNRSPPPFTPVQDPSLQLASLTKILRQHCSIWRFASSLSSSETLTPAALIDIEGLLKEHVADAHLEDSRVEIENRDKGKKKETDEDAGWRKPMEMVDISEPGYHVFGQPLSLTRMYASCVSSMAGFQHDLPIVVYACVEELYRTGMTVPGLFRTPPDRKRHNELIDLFDTGPSFGRNLSLATESTPDICALLRSYIDRLPSPIWHESLFDAMWILCVLPSKQCESLLVQESEHEVNVNARERKKTKQTRPTSLIFFKKTVPDAKPTGDMHRTRSSSLNTNFSSSTLGPTASPEDGLSRERLQLAVSRILFRLLPRTNLALLAYLCAFFTQLPLSPQNQLGIEDVARLFAAPLFLGKPHSGVGEVRHGTATGATWAVRKEEACTMMVWILRRWAHISDGLFELDRSNDADGCGSVVEDTVAQDDCASATSSDSESVYSLLSMYAWPEADIRAHDETDTLLDAHDLNSNGQSISASVLTADMRPPPAQKSALVQQMESASSCMHPDVDFLTWKRVVEKDIDELRNALVDVRARLDQKTSPAT